MGISDVLERARLIGTPDDDMPSDQDISSLDEEFGTLDDLLEPDPVPAAKQPGAKSRKQRPAIVPKATAAEKRQVKDALTMMQLMIGGGIALRDKHCGPAIVDSAEAVADKAVPIIARNPTWLGWFTGSTGFLDVLGLIIALKPVLGTFWGHHVSHSIGGADGGHDQAEDFSQFTAPEL